jgi:hypothetical protein
LAGFLSISEPAPVDSATPPPRPVDRLNTSLAAGIGTDIAEPRAPLESEVPDPSETVSVTPRDVLALESQIKDLRIRLASVEQTLSRLPSASAAVANAADSERPEAPRTPQERTAALVAVGVDPILAEDLIAREAERSLDQLSLRDQAIREGWIGTAEYREELARINADARPLRDEIGAEAYDRYLFATGEDNRVEVTAVIPGSAAEIAGLQPGDLIEAYADERLFRFSELRSKTTEGEYGEPVALRVRRGGDVVEAWVPRGPLGVTLDSARAKPQP